MSTNSATIEQTNTRLMSRVADYVELTKPRIAVMMLISVGVAAVVAKWQQPDLWMLFHVIMGVGFVAASASAANQVLERESDGRMERTLRRPLPAGRLSSRQAVRFAAITLLAGIAYLSVTSPWPVAAWSLATWVLYVILYTPLKRYSVWNTFVGAISGALPICIGWAAAEGTYDLRLAGLFTTMFLWQFPHFMAIAWLFRKQYERAGLQMMTVVDGSGQRAGVQAVLTAVGLLPVSLIPALHGPAPAAGLYAALALVLGIGQLVTAVLFFANRTDQTARLLLRASLIYLPLLLGLLLLIPLV
ncbi:MAG: heme o synthase [Planctomycetota bacterium]